MRIPLRIISYYNTIWSGYNKLYALGSLKGSMSLSNHIMIYKQDYELVVNWDINGNLYWKLYRKGIPVIASEEKKELVRSVLKL